RLHRQRQPVGGLPQGRPGLQELAGADHRQQAGAVARLPVSRSVRRAGPRGSRDGPGRLRRNAMAEAIANIPLAPARTAEEKTSLITGSEAIAIACQLADVDVITAYPIRPYDTVMQYVAKLASNGEMDCDYIVAEREHSQFESVKHASACGARVFTGSSGVGWMYA